jgi:hypothetical protein
MKCVIVHVYDHSGLGGPMGSEHVELTATHAEPTIEAAREWAVKDARRRLKRNINQADLSDLGPIGYSFKRQ